eukprot:Rhum_TRINITY_DN3362_c0_g1::Rhum_TRINITY_DN3362_c0_g1_i1::g.10590::m.10590
MRVRGEGGKCGCELRGGGGLNNNREVLTRPLIARRRRPAEGVPVVRNGREPGDGSASCGHRRHGTGSRHEAGCAGAARVHAGPGRGTQGERRPLGAAVRRLAVLVVAVVLPAFGGQRVGAGLGNERPECVGGRRRKRGLLAERLRGRRQRLAGVVGWVGLDIQLLVRRELGEGHVVVHRRHLALRRAELGRRVQLRAPRRDDCGRVLVLPPPLALLVEAHCNEEQAAAQEDAAEDKGPDGNAVVVAGTGGAESRRVDHEGRRGVADGRTRAGEVLRGGDGVAFRGHAVGDVGVAEDRRVEALCEILARPAALGAVVKRHEEKGLRRRRPAGVLQLHDVNTVVLLQREAAALQVHLLAHGFLEGGCVEARRVAHVRALRAHPYQHRVLLDAPRVGQNKRCRRRLRRRSRRYRCPQRVWRRHVFFVVGL